ncbi:sperm flagellar protein 1, putative [Ichthyophthirius multifiliis]|uniref:Sperm flagellar protein 1, putative n=1 Tax=Ichthyophthirius multifiliis TaxID=5932 RepID=G0R5N0_ICHMU|nr:sperm flagellar protein 1, putative [Ichthyophthirius multifiliis]EGR27238.1 sperm flagellar protein 1, putative [Ichthyophthirius multifiliis]|eukprot:XP_004024122.1 sperm flagellar protein 1, putative [Ichthyophthirius multifiliis]
MDAPQLNEDELNEIYSWIDSISLSRPKKNMARDFADGVLMAEVIANFFPRLVQLHNYSGANSMKQKVYNWETLQQKVFRKLGLQISKQDINNIINCVPESIERVLRVIQIRIQDMINEQQNNSPLKIQNNSCERNVQNNYSNSRNNQSQNVNEMQNILNRFKLFYINKIYFRNKQKLKIRKLEDLIKLKDNKINTLQNKLGEHGLY